jgi:hypothetical protein
MSKFDKVDEAIIFPFQGYEKNWFENPMFSVFWIMSTLAWVDPYFLHTILGCVNRCELCVIS